MLDDRGRRTCRGKQSDESGGAAEAQHAALGDGRNFRSRRKPFAVDEPERDQAAGLDMRIGGGEVDGRERNLAGDEIDHRWRAAAIGQI